VLYTALGAEVFCHAVDLETTDLTLVGTVSVPSAIQYACSDPTRQYPYVASSDRAASLPREFHHVTAYAIDRVTGRLGQLGEATCLRSRPVHITTDGTGRFLLTAYNAPSLIAVHHLHPGGSVGEEVQQQQGLDFGIYAHQVRITPSNQHIILVTRGNDADTERREDPGAFKVFGFQAGHLSAGDSIAPGGGSALAGGIHGLS